MLVGLPPDSGMTAAFSVVSTSTLVKKIPCVICSIPFRFGADCRTFGCLYSHPDEEARKREIKKAPPEPEWRRQLLAFEEDAGRPQSVLSIITSLGILKYP